MIRERLDRKKSFMAVSKCCMRSERDGKCTCHIIRENGRRTTFTDTMKAAEAAGKLI